MDIKQKILMKGLLAVITVYVIVFGLLCWKMIRPEEIPLEGKITAILNLEQNLFWENTWKGMRQEANELRYELAEYQVNSQESIADYLEIALLTDTDGIIFNASFLKDEESVQFLDMAYDREIPLITLDTAYEDIPVLSLTNNNPLSGEMIANYILEQIGEERIILLSYDVNYSSSLSIRQEAIQNALEEAGYADKLILLTIPDEELEIREYLADYLSDMDSPVFLVGCGPQQTLYAARTVSALKLSDQVRVVGFGESEEAIDFAESGVIEAMLVQDNEQMGRLAIQYMKEMQEKKLSLPCTVFVDSYLYTNDNIDSLILTE